MAGPLTLLAPALGALKGASGLGIAKGAAQMGGFMKGAAARRMAGDALKKFATSGKGMKGINMADDAGILDRIKRGVTPGGFAKNLGVPLSNSDKAMMVAPDLLFGGMAAIMTPGDLGDKAIAGIGSAAGGIAGGVGLRGVLGPTSDLGRLGTEMVGGIAGDMVGMGVADNIIRAKNGGMTPMEQQYAEQDAIYRQQLRDQFLAENGLG